MLAQRIANRETGIILYGITPPKTGTPVERQSEIAALQTERLASLGLDGLVIYDIQDEASRTKLDRPFPFMPTEDGAAYSQNHLKSLNLPKIIYRAVGKYSRDELSAFAKDQAKNENLSVFVGAASKNEPVRLSIKEAYAVRSQSAPSLCLGGVAIAERHRIKKDEHLRITRKTEAGCSFFITQGVYDTTAAKDFLSDYYYHCRDTGREPVPILFTFTPCGSLKTMQFMRWLGIDIPRWLENELSHASDILETSLNICEAAWHELREFAAAKQMPVGCNIESVSIRKVEVEASIELVKRVQSINSRESHKTDHANR